MIKKRKYTPEEQNEFFGWLGYRLFSTVIRGHLLIHRRPLSAARDYLRLESVKEGVERDACEFLRDVAGVGRLGGLTLKEIFEKWSEAAWWQPWAPPPECELCIDKIDEPHVEARSAGARVTAQRPGRF